MSISQTLYQLECARCGRHLGARPGRWSGHEHETIRTTCGGCRAGPLFQPEPEEGFWVGVRNGLAVMAAFVGFALWLRWWL